MELSQLQNYVSYSELYEISKNNPPDISPLLQKALQVDSSPTLLANTIVVLPPSQMLEEITLVFFSKMQNNQAAIKNLILAAAATGNLTMLQKGIGYYKGDKVKVKDGDGITPLHLACQFGHLKMAQFLVGQGADPKAEDQFGNTPLHRAASKELVYFLVGKGADVHAVNKKGTTPIHNASTPSMVDALLQCGANLEVKDCSGRNPLHLAFKTGNAPLVAHLLGPTLLDVDKFYFFPFEYGVKREEITKTFSPFYQELMELAILVRNQKRGEFQAKLMEKPLEAFLETATTAVFMPLVGKAIFEWGIDKLFNYALYNNENSRSLLTPDEQLKIVAELSLKEKERILKKKIELTEKNYVTPQEALHQRAEVAIPNISPLAIALLAQDDTNRKIVTDNFRKLNVRQFKMFVSILPPKEWLELYCKSDFDKSLLLNATLAQLKLLEVGHILEPTFSSLQERLEEIKTDLQNDFDPDSLEEKILTLSTRWTYLKLKAVLPAIENPHLAVHNKVITLLKTAIEEKINQFDSEFNRIKLAFAEKYD